MAASSPGTGSASFGHKRLFSHMFSPSSPSRIWGFRRRRDYTLIMSSLLAYLLLSTKLVSKSNARKVLDLSSEMLQQYTSTMKMGGLISGVRRNDREYLIVTDAGKSWLLCNAVLQPAVREPNREFMENVAGELESRGYRAEAKPHVQLCKSCSLCNATFDLAVTHSAGTTFAYVATDKSTALTYLAAAWLLNSSMGLRVVVAMPLNGYEKMRDLLKAHMAYVSLYQEPEAWAVADAIAAWIESSNAAGLDGLQATREAVRTRI